MRDVIIVGAGLGGLSAAWRLRHWDTLILESRERLGGRIRSQYKDGYVLNLGGHVFPGEGSAMGDLMAETGVESTEIPGNLAAISMNGKLLTKGSVPSYAFRLPMKLRDRINLMTTGARVSLDVIRYARATTRRRGESAGDVQKRTLAFENERNFADYLGKVNEDVEALFIPTVTRSSGAPHEISAGAGIGYFSLVWNVGAGLNRAILGGPSTLIETIAASQRERIQLGAKVTEVTQHENHVTVTYVQDGVEHTEQARRVVMASTADVTRKVVTNFRPSLQQALEQIKYGTWVSAAFPTKETTPQAWDDCYGIATPKRSMAIVLNQANVVRGHETHRAPGGSIMVFSPAELADRLLPLSEEEIKEIYLDDLDEILPGFRNIADVDNAIIAKWHTGGPYIFPGRAKLQDELLRPDRLIHLAGDFLGSKYGESAVESGFAAAQQIASSLATEHQTTQQAMKASSHSNHNA